MSSTATAPEGATEEPAKPKRISTAGVKKVPSILQIEAVECGAASLGMILASMGKWEPLSALRSACRVSRDGATATGIMQAAQDFGLEPHGRMASLEELQDNPVPAIVWWKHRHFVVLEGAKDGRFHVNDPALGPMKYTQEYFAQNFSGAVISFTPTDRFEKGGKPYRTLPSLWSRLTGSQRGVWFAVVAGLLAMFPGLLLAPVSSTFIDDVLDVNEQTFLPFLLGTLVFVIVTRMLLISLEYKALAKVQARVAFGNNAEFLMRMFRLPLLFFASRNIGDLVQRMGYSSAVAQLLAGSLAASLISLISVVAYVAMMIYYSWILAVVVVLLTAVNIVALRAVVKRRTVGQGLLMSESGHLQSITIGTIQSIETVKASGIERDVFAQWTGQQTKVVNAEASFVTPTAIISAVPTVVTMLTTTSILVIGGILVVQGDLALGALLAFQALVAGIVAPVNMLVATASQIQTIQVDLQRLDDVFDHDMDGRFQASDRPTAPVASTAGVSGSQALDEVRSASLVPLSGEVTLTDVEFGFTEGDPPLIQGLSLTLTPGHRVALVGPSGAGKSTIGNIIAGLYMPWSGSVTYDGRTITEIDPQVMSLGLAKVDQTIMLFAGTVRQNVTLWDESVPEELVIKALQDAQVLDRVLQRPNGLDTEVIEGGLNFSTGETQRLEIARALVRNPAILIMDEATSNLDTTTEKAMDDAVRARGCSTVVIAHRLSTIRDADEIIVLDRGGVIAERGTSDSLLAQGGIYARLVASAGSGGDVGT